MSEIKPDPVAASPEGSAGLDVKKLQFLLEELASDLDTYQGAFDRNEPAMVRALAYELPSLIDASRERDTLRKQWDDGFLSRVYWGRVAHLLTGGEDGTPIDFEKVHEAAARYAQLEAQLTDARSRVSELETAADLADKKRHDAFDQLEALRLSREQAIAAIMAIPPVAPDSPVLEESYVPHVPLPAVLSILRGAE